MQNLEPYNLWTNLYVAAADRRSPFYGRKYHPYLCSNTIYNYYIHPQWDEIGSETLYIKILYACYEYGFCVIELLGEWNDCLYNDIMYLKRNIVDQMIDQGIKKFILIGENVLNFHASENDYYQEWFEDIENGWIAILNIRNHVLDEFRTIYIDQYIAMDGPLNHISWRVFTPLHLLREVEKAIKRRLASHFY